MNLWKKERSQARLLSWSWGWSWKATKHQAKILTHTNLLIPTSSGRTDHEGTEFKKELSEIPLPPHLTSQRTSTSSTESSVHIVRYDRYVLSRLKLMGKSRISTVRIRSKILLPDLATNHDGRSPKMQPSSGVKRIR